jgi:hypothetical protein
MPRAAAALLTVAAGCHGDAAASMKGVAARNPSLELYLMWRARGMPLETPAVPP